MLQLWWQRGHARLTSVLLRNDFDWVARHQEAQVAQQDAKQYSNHTIGKALWQQQVAPADAACGRQVDARQWHILHSV